MKINLVFFGKTAKKFVSDGETFFQERLKPFAQMEIVILSEEKIGKTTTEKQVKDTEAEKFFAQFPKEKCGFLLVCDVQGKQFSSEQFAEFVEKIRDEHGKMTMVIGGALGLSEKILHKADAKISFSPMTFPHDFFRLLLLEQLYRSFMIMGGREYHK